jgi:hypothetical protein
MTRNEQVYTMAQDWIYWLDTRKFFGEAPQQNILARMIAERSQSNGVPDIELSAEMSAFNLAVCSLEVGLFVPFIVVYCGYKPKPIKCMADEMSIGRDQFYERAHRAASRIAGTTRQLIRLNEEMRSEVLGYV